MFNRINRSRTQPLISLAVVLLALSSAAARGGEANLWSGTWAAEGTLFSIAIEVRENMLHVEEVESLGFQWSASPGRVNGDTANFQVSYAGATASVQARIIESGLARVTASDCVPEFIVVCVLIRNQFAMFYRTSAASASR